MTLPIHPEMLAAAYEYLRATDPFRKWNLPESEDLTFRVLRTRKLCGQYWMDGDKHFIAISSGKIGCTHSLMETMAHEMLHLHLAETGMDDGGEHNAAFRKIADRVCRAHGFDPKMF